MDKRHIFKMHSIYCIVLTYVCSKNQTQLDKNK